MSIAVNDFEHTLDSLCGVNAQFELRNVFAWFESKDKNKDNDDNEKKQLGYKYQVKNRDLAVKFDVKVESETPIISALDLRKSPTRINVTFTNTRASFYGNSLYDCELSAFAEKIAIVGVSEKEQDDNFRLPTKK